MNGNNEGKTTQGETNDAYVYVPEVRRTYTYREGVTNGENPLIHIRRPSLGLLKTLNLDKK